MASADLPAIEAVTETTSASQETNDVVPMATSTPVSGGRCMRKRRQAENYLAGAYRRAYTVSPTLYASLKSSTSSDVDDELNEQQKKRKELCCTCPPTLIHLAEKYAQIGRHGKELKRRKSTHQNPKKLGKKQYRNITAENQWIRENLFDAMGNYLYCQPCILAFINVFSERLRKQRLIKQQQSQGPIKQMIKSEVIQQKLEAYVLMPDVCTESFHVWWHHVPINTMVDVRYPYHRHGLEGKTSNHAKTAALKDFLQFVDCNSQPNGRQSGSYSVQFYLLPQFTRIDSPKPGEKNFEEKERSSVVSQFNRAQQSKEGQTISSFTARAWLKTHRPKHGLCPHMTDYCDYCKRIHEEECRTKTTLDRLRQSGSAPELKLKELEEQLTQLSADCTEHKTDANRAREEHQKCIAKCAKEWEKICDLEEKPNRTHDEDGELAVLKHFFTLTLSMDYQMSKLIPHWGATAQPGQSYYLMKVSHDILGIIDHRNDGKTVYIFDERLGPKNTDHTISLAEDYIRGVVQDYPWIKRICLFLDNAGSTNKNKYFFAWNMEFVKSGAVDSFRVAFLVAGHTKFSPDRLFATIANRYKTSNVFNIHELQDICSHDATTNIVNGNAILKWRDYLHTKYSDLPGIRKLHDFLTVRDHQGGVVMKVRVRCYEGQFTNSPLKIIGENSDARPQAHYEGHREITQDKMSHMSTMCEKWINYVSGALTPTMSNPPTAMMTSNLPTATSAQSTRNKKKCTVEGCDGTGHKNRARWHEGHTTRAGCPVYHGLLEE